MSQVAKLNYVFIFIIKSILIWNVFSHFPTDRCIFFKYLVSSTTVTTSAATTSQSNNNPKQREVPAKKKSSGLDKPSRQSSQYVSLKPKKSSDRVIMSDHSDDEQQVTSTQSRKKEPPTSKTYEEEHHVIPHRSSGRRAPLQSPNLALSAERQSVRKLRTRTLPPSPHDDDEDEYGAVTQRAAKRDVAPQRGVQSSPSPEEKRYKQRKRAAEVYQYNVDEDSDIPQTVKLAGNNSNLVVIMIVGLLLPLFSLNCDGNINGGDRSVVL